LRHRHRRDGTLQAGLVFHQQALGQLVIDQLLQSHRSLLLCLR
jgi:hypothetical protein